MANLAQRHIWRKLGRLGRVCGLLHLLSLGSATSTASAQVSLDYEAPADCPSEQDFRDTVAARLGRDPFAPANGQVVVVRVEIQRSALQGEVTLMQGGAMLTTRRIRGARGECREVVTSLGIAISIMLDSNDGGSSRTPTTASDPSLTSAPAPAPAPAPPTPTLSPPDRPSANRPRFLASVGGGGTVGSAPSVVLSVDVAVGMSFGAITLWIEGAADLMPRAATLDSGDQLETNIFHAGPVGCFSYGIFLGCAGAMFGALQSRAIHVVNPATHTSFWGAGELRGGAQTEFVASWLLIALAELRIPLVRSSTEIGGDIVWTAPAVAGGLRIAFARIF